MTRFPTRRVEFGVCGCRQPSSPIVFFIITGVVVLAGCGAQPSTGGKPQAAGVLQGPAKPGGGEKTQPSAPVAPEGSKSAQPVSGDLEKILHDLASLREAVDRLAADVGAIQTPQSNDAALQRELAALRSEFEKLQRHFTLTREQQEQLNQIGMSVRAAADLSAAQVSDLRNKLQALIDQIPATALAQVSRQVSALITELEGWELAVNAENAESLLPLLQDYLAENGDSLGGRLKQKLEAKLQQSLEDSERRAAAAKSEAQREARRLMGNGQAGQALETLRLYAGDADVQPLLDQAEDQLRLDQLKAILEQASQLERGTQRNLVYSTLLHGALSGRMERGAQTEKWAGFLSEIEAAIAQEHKQAEELAAERHRKYQEWAIDRIQRFTQSWTADECRKDVRRWLSDMTKDEDSTLPYDILKYDLVRAFVESKTGLTFANGHAPSADARRKIAEKFKGDFRFDGETSLSQLLRAEGMIEKFGPIDERLLERPVQLAYTQAFDEAWKELAGVEIQWPVGKKVIKPHLEIALRMAKTRKYTLEEMDNGTP